MSLQQLEFTTTSIRNVVISTRCDSIYYEVTTPEWEPHLTRIRRLDPVAKAYSTIAEILNEKDRPAAIYMYGRELIPAEQFLQRKDDGPHTIGGFRGKDGKAYTWRVNDSHGYLELLRDDMSEYHPLATYNPPRRYMHVLRMSQRPSLEVDSLALDTLDTLIVTFLIAERHRREKSPTTHVGAPTAREEAPLV